VVLIVFVDLHAGQGGPVVWTADVSFMRAEYRA
jgi:hypothetical protein